MSSVDLHVALASDQKFYPGLLVAAASIAFFSDERRSLSLHILDGGISGPAWRRLEAVVRRLHPRVELNRLSVIDSGILEIRDNGRKGPTIYARLLLPRMLDSQRVVYVDSDCLAVGDLGSLMEVDLCGRPCAAVQDPVVPSLGSDYPWPPPDQFSPESPYLNSGLLVIDIDQWRKERVSEQTFQVLKRDGTRCTYWDQTALNRVLQGRWQALSSAWNYPSKKFDFRSARETHLLHYLSIEKPWCSDSGSEAQEVWRRFASEVVGFTFTEWPWSLYRDHLRVRFHENATGLIWAAYVTKHFCQRIFSGSRFGAHNQWAVRYWSERRAQRHKRKERNRAFRGFLASQSASWRKRMVKRASEMKR
jgi:lipopolysaccharide biosynthesis glycosyltransferase